MTAAFGVAVAFGILSGGLGRGIRDGWWYLAVGLEGLGIYSLGTLIARREPSIPRALILLYGATLAAATLIAFVNALVLYQTQHRVALWFPNANLLGASLAVAGSLIVVLFSSSWLRWSMALATTAAIVGTGSRTSLIAFIVFAALTWLFATTGRLQKSALRIALISAACLALIDAGVVLTPSIGADRHKNLLQYSDTLTHSAWYTNYAREVTISSVDVAGPEPGGKVSAVVAEGDASSLYPGLVLTQYAGRSKPGEQYVASIWLRSSTPQEVILDSNLARTLCSVGPTWERCATPVAYGDAYRSVQLQLWTAKPGGRFEVYVWGPQLEVGLEPSPVEHTSRQPIFDYLDNVIGRRLDVRRWHDDLSLNIKTRAFGLAMEMFRESPIVGNGLGSFRKRVEAIDAADEMSAAHAHNIVLQSLAESGILGLLAWLVPLVVVFVLLAPNWRHFVPLFVCLAVLNMFDYTYFFGGVYATWWLGMAAYLTSTSK